MTAPAMSPDELIRRIEALPWDIGGRLRLMIPVAEIPEEIQKAMMYPNNRIDSREHQYELTDRYLWKIREIEVAERLKEFSGRVFEQMELAGLKKVSESHGKGGRVVLVESPTNPSRKEYLIPIYPDRLRTRYSCPICRREISGISYVIALTNMRRHLEGHSH
jgi:hypothetical protein